MHIQREFRKRLLIPLAILLCSDSAAEVVIPIEIDNGNPIASARINGVPVKLVIDSGGGVVVLKPQAARNVAARRTGATKSANDPYGNASAQESLLLDTLELGGQTFTTVEAAEFNGEVPHDGSIGRAFLNRFLAIYDYSSRTVTLFAREERAVAKRKCRGAMARTIPHPEGIIVSMATADGRAIRIVWDSGASISFMKESFANRHQLSVKDSFHTSRRFDLGGKDFGPLQFVVVDASQPAGVDGFLGYNFFADHVVCIDPIGESVSVRESHPRP